LEKPAFVPICPHQGREAEGELSGLEGLLSCSSFLREIEECEKF
jgi:hypothetical protein